MSKTKKWTLWGVGLLALVCAFYLGTGYQEHHDLATLVGVPDTGEMADTPDNQGVVYACDAGKSISAEYYAAAAVEPVLGEEPLPTGWVQVSLDGAPSVRLNQAVSADGARYTNADESLTFWSKGDEALILKNNSMDLAYKNCKAKD
jgi:membrane-bound inhibitor of C-type lysozyme